MFIQTTGGVLTGQADAICLGCARALCLMDQTYRAELKAKGFLTRNALKKERGSIGATRETRSHGGVSIGPTRPWNCVTVDGGGWTRVGSHEHVGVSRAVLDVPRERGESH